MFHVPSDSDRLKHAQKHVRSANMASVCSFDVVLARSFEPSRPDRLADPKVPFVPLFFVSSLKHSVNHVSSAK